MSKNPKNDIFKLLNKLKNISNNPGLEKNTRRNNLVNFTMRNWKYFTWKYLSTFIQTGRNI